VLAQSEAVKSHRPIKDTHVLAGRQARRSRLHERGGHAARHEVDGDVAADGVEERVHFLCGGVGGQEGHDDDAQ
jgi:hypothetical protein